MGSKGSIRRVPITCLGPAAQKQVIAQLAEAGPRRASFAEPVPEPANKYGVSAAAERTYNGVVFASKLEMNCARRLDVLGIKYRTQVPFVLQEGFVREGRKLREVAYLADFVITTTDGRTVVLEAKGLFLPEAKLKMELLLFRYPDLIFRIATSPAELTKAVSDLGLLVNKT
jgi:hypothetical protein